MTTTNNFQLPHSAQAEENVIGALIQWPETFPRVADKLRPEDFYFAAMRAAYETMLGIDAKGKRIDLFEVIEALDGTHEGSNWLETITTCAQNVPSSHNITRYAEVIRERSVLRQLIAGGQKIQELAMSGEPLSSVLEQAQAVTTGLADSSASTGPRHIKSIIKNYADVLDHRMNQQGGIVGMATGLTELDARYKGWKPGDLIILAARPAMGKTTLAMNIVERVSVFEQKLGLVFSMEMPEEQLLDRMMSSTGQIPLGMIKDGSAVSHMDHSHKINSAAGRLIDSGVHIDDTPGLTITELRARTRRVAQDKGQIGIIMVDYLQLMSGTDSRDNREQEISKISRGLKGLAKEMGCPVLALSQLNRSLENRTDKVPIMSDLRESGAIEQDADIIMFIYRDEVYHDDSNMKGVAQIKTAKFRNGETGSDYLAAKLDISRFEDLAHDWSKPEKAVAVAGRNRGFE